MPPCMTTRPGNVKLQSAHIWDLSPEKPYHDISDFWDGEVPESNLE